MMLRQSQESQDNREKDGKKEEIEDSKQKENVPSLLSRLSASWKRSTHRLSRQMSGLYEKPHSDRTEEIRLKKNADALAAARGAKKFQIYTFYSSREEEKTAQKTEMEMLNLSNFKNKANTLITELYKNEDSLRKKYKTWKQAINKERNESNKNKDKSKQQNLLKYKHQVKYVDAKAKKEIELLENNIERLKE